MQNTTEDLPVLTRETFLANLNVPQMDKAMEAIRLADKLDELKRQQDKVKDELRKATDYFNKMRAAAEECDPSLTKRRFQLHHIVLFLEFDAGATALHSTRS